MIYILPFTREVFLNYQVVFCCSCEKPGEPVPDVTPEKPDPEGPEFPAGPEPPTDPPVSIGR